MLKTNRGCEARISYLVLVEAQVSWLDVGTRGFITAAMVGNAIYICVIADSKPSLWIAVCDNCFTGCFALEAMVLFYRNGIHGYFADPSRRLDFLLVCLSIAEVWILVQIKLKADMHSFMAIRCLRLMRVTQLVRVFSVKRELNVFIFSVIGAFRVIVG